MALNTRQQIALYLLMGTHGRSPGDMSALYNTVVANTPQVPGQAQDFAPALRAAAQGLDNTIQPGDIGPLPDLSGNSLRQSLGFLIYPPGTACLNANDQQNAYNAMTR